MWSVLITHLKGIFLSHKQFKFLKKWSVYLQKVGEN
jgi:hypothetical protein